MFRVHWKGCPHRRLPRIRLPPVRSSASRVRLAQDAAEAVHILPFGSALKKAREKERIRARRRRTRSRSRTHSDQTNVSLKALRNIEVFGWDSVRHFDSLGGENIRIGSKEEGFLDLSKSYQVIDSISRVHGGLVEYSGNRPRPRMDGACSSKTPSNFANADIPKERRFTPAHWNKGTKPGQDIPPFGEPSRATTFGGTRVSGPYLPNFSSTDPTQTAPTPAGPKRSEAVRIPAKRVPIKGVPITNAPSRSRTYDPRLPTKKVTVKEDRQRVTKSSPTSSRSPDLARKVSITSKAISRSNKRRGWTSPEFRSALNSIVNQRRESNGDPKTSDIDATEQSRTSSERRALDKFTAELAKSLADPKRIRRPTQPSTAPSIHTIDDLQPYAPEFRAAGLSVTFQDQVLNAPRFRQIQTPAKDQQEDISYNLRTFSFERKRTRPADGPADMQKNPAKAPAWNSETPSDVETSSASSWGEGHHHVRRIKANANANQGPPRQPPPAPPAAPPRPIERTEPRVQDAGPQIEKKAPAKVFNSPSETSPSSSASSFTAGHHHVRTVKNAQQKPVMREVKYAETTPTRVPRKASKTQVILPVQPSKKSIPWLQAGERSPRTRTEGPTAWQEENITSPPIVSSDSSFITVIDWSPIEDPRANLDVFPLIARPSEVEWVEMNYERGRQSTANPAIRVVDMKKKPKGEETDPISTVDIMPIEKAEESAMIVPVNVISITPVSSVYSFGSSKKARPRIPDRPLLCTQCGRLLAFPLPVIPPRPANPHDCTRKSSVCEDYAPSKIEVPLSPKRVSLIQELPSPIGSPPPPIVPVRPIRRTGTVFREPPIAASPSIDAGGSTLSFPRFQEITENFETTNNASSEQIVEAISQTRVSSPKRINPDPLAVSNRGSMDTIADIISHYSPAESISRTTTPTAAPEVGDSEPLKDRDIFRGLQVVTLAACDQDVDTWIQDMSGPGIRKFLADVSEFEKMGIGELSRQARRTARRQRREFEKALKEKEVMQIQNDGVGEGSDGSGSSTLKAWKAIDTGHERTNHMDGKVGFVASDEPICHIPEPGREVWGSGAQYQERDEDTHSVTCECNDETRAQKGKGKEKEPQTRENIRSRRDRFGTRDGHFR